MFTILICISSNHDMADSKSQCHKLSVSVISLQFIKKNQD